MLSFQVDYVHKVLDSSLFNNVKHFLYFSANSQEEVLGPDHPVTRRGHIYSQLGVANICENLTEIILPKKVPYTPLPVVPLPRSVTTREIAPRGGGGGIDD